MPTVPTYDGPTLQRQALRGGESNSRADPEALGGAQARQLNQLGQGLGQMADVAQQYQDRNDLSEAFKVETAVMRDYNMYEQELRKTRRGDNAKGVTEDVSKWWEESRSKYGADLNPRAMRVLEKSLGRAQTSALARAGEFQMGEEDRAQVENYTAVQGTEIQTAITDGKPEAIAASREKLLQATAAFGATRGWSPGRLEQENRKWTNTLHIQAISSMVDGDKADPVAAKAYFEANRSEIDSANRKRIGDLVDKAVAEKQADDKVAELSKLPMEQQLEEAKKVTDTDMRKRVLTGVKANADELEIAQRAREKAASDKVWQLVANGAPLNKLPKTVLEQMDGKERVQLNAHYEADRNRRKAEASGGSVKTDYKVYEELVNMPTDTFLNTRLSSYQDKLSRGDLEKLIDRQAKMRNPKEAGEVASTEQHMGTYTSTLGLKDDRKGAFQSAAYNEFNEFRKANKREPNFDERQKILDRLSIKSDGGWFGSDKYFFETPAKDQGKFVDEHVPRADRMEIIAELKKRGKPVTTQNILDLYQAANK